MMNQTDLNYLSKLIEVSSSIVVFTGAGISTESGIPDYRGPQGIWTLNPELQFPKEPVAELQIISDLKATVADAEPNDGHKAIVTLWEQGKLLSVITQNVDRLHQKAGLIDGIVHELHGSGDNIVPFGGMLDETTWYKAKQSVINCSLMIVMGSSLQVYPAAYLVEEAQKSGWIDTVIINQQPTDYDRDATLVIREPIGEVVKALGLV